MSALWPKVQRGRSRATHTQVRAHAAQQAQPSCPSEIEALKETFQINSDSSSISKCENTESIGVDAKLFNDEMHIFYFAIDEMQKWDG